MLCQIREQREYIQKVTRAVEEYGLPYPIVPKQPISVNMSKYVPSRLLFMYLHVYVLHVFAKLCTTP